MTQSAQTAIYITKPIKKSKQLWSKIQKLDLTFGTHDKNDDSEPQIIAEEIIKLVKSIKKY